MEMRWECWRLAAAITFGFGLAMLFASAEESVERKVLSSGGSQDIDMDGFTKIANFFWQPDRSSYQHVWPELKFGWSIVVGSIIGFFGAAFGSVGGVGGGGMIMGAAGSTVYYNLRLRHPTLDMPIIDYDLALLVQPMLMLGISIGVAFNVIFADWMDICVSTSTKAFLRGVATWKKETIAKKEAARRLESSQIAGEEVEYKPIPGGPTIVVQRETMASGDEEVPILKNIYWKELGLLVFVWFAFLALQITKVWSPYYLDSALGESGTIANNLPIDILQIPVAVGVSLHEAVSLYNGRRVIASKGDQGTNWTAGQLILYSFCGILAGIVGGLLGLGGGFIMGPLFLELGIPPQVSSATATFAMTFSSSMSVVEYYLLKRFPVPYALYFIAVATVAAFVGQHVVRKIILLIGRASLIIFILAFTIFVSAISLGNDMNFILHIVIRSLEKLEMLSFSDILGAT
ncbi:hypothetical protein ACLOJK_020244 [Asimina triloba]